VVKQDLHDVGWQATGQGIGRKDAPPSLMMLARSAHPRINVQTVPDEIGPSSGPQCLADRIGRSPMKC
jgi:hypothetical protein